MSGPGRLGFDDRVDGDAVSYAICGPDRTGHDEAGSEGLLVAGPDRVDVCDVVRDGVHPGRETAAPDIAISRLLNIIVSAASDRGAKTPSLKFNALTRASY